MLNLDTHILLGVVFDELTPTEKKLLRSDRWSVSAMVLWETAKLVQLGRVELDVDGAEFRAALAPIHIWPVTLDVCRQSVRLDFKSDPADELIAATSIVHGVPLVTRDRRIRRSRMVPFPKN